MKKILCLCFIMFIITGCGKNKNQEWQNEMKKHATVYYEEYMKNVSGQLQNDISIEAFKNVNKNVGQKFDLKKLSSCKDSSYVTITVDSKTRKITNYTYHLDCK